MSAEEHNSLRTHPIGDAYDYIITGAGCAGLSLVVHMVRSESLRHKKILLVDQSAKTEGDRTWCFWEKGNGPFQECVHHEWSRLHFHAAHFSDELHIAPYKYKLIRGGDFYRYCKALIAGHPNIQWVQGTVEKVESGGEKPTVTIDGRAVTGRYVFNSILFSQPALKPQHYWLLQHFRGWFIKTATPHFTTGSATLMDFRTDQSEGATFFYVLPFSPTEALVEYTLFSPALLGDEAYDNALETYVREVLRIGDYSITERENGVIPMTNYTFPAGEGAVVNIGTAGGQTKGSSGYTFRAIQKHSAAIVASLERGKDPHGARRSDHRFRFYDSVLLRILAKKELEGAAIFSDLFRKNKPGQVLKFLDNDSSLVEEVGLISKLPIIPFSKAALAHLLQ